MPLLVAFFRDASGAPVTGLTPTVDIADGDTPAGPLVVSAAGMTEVTILAGMYVYNFLTGAGWTSALRWLGRADGGAALGANRYQGVFPLSPADESGESAFLNATGLQTDAVAEIVTAVLAEILTSGESVDVALSRLDNIDTSVTTTIPGLIAALNDISVADILTAVLVGSGESVDLALSRLDNIDTSVTTTIPGLIAALNDISVSDILTAVLSGSGESVDTALSRLDNIDTSVTTTIPALITALNDISVADILAAVLTSGDTVNAALSRLIAFNIAGRVNNNDLDALLGVPDSAGVDLVDRIAVFLETAGPNPHGTGAWDATATVPPQTIRDAMKLAPTAGAPAAGSVDEHLDDILSTGGPGPWTTGAGTTPQAIRDAMKLTPTVGAPAAGSVDEHLDDILADTAAIDARLPADPADESNQLAAHATTQAAIAALNDITAAEVRDIALAGSAAGSLGEGVLIAKNMKLAYRLDMIVRDPVTGFMLSARLRIFATQAAADASTKDAVGIEGAIAVSTITGTPDVTFTLLPDDVVAGT